MTEGPVAQRLEQRPHKVTVPGSTPGGPNQFDRDFPVKPVIFTLHDVLLEKYAKGRTGVWAFCHVHTGETAGNWEYYPAVIQRRQIDKASFYCDGVYYIVLVVHNTVVACIGLRKVPYSTRVLVCQIQARVGVKEALVGIRWEKLLLHAACDYLFARTATSEVRVLAAESNKWYPRLEDNPLNTQDYIDRINDKCFRMKMHYDVTAKRLGFKKGPNPAKGIKVTDDKPYLYYVLSRRAYKLLPPLPPASPEICGTLDEWTMTPTLDLPSF